MKFQKLKIVNVQVDHNNNVSVHLMSEGNKIFAGGSEHDIDIAVELTCSRSAVKDFRIGDFYKVTLEKEE